MAEYPEDKIKTLVSTSSMDGTVTITIKILEEWMSARALASALTMIVDRELDLVAKDTLRRLLLGPEGLEAISQALGTAIAERLKTLEAD